MCWCMSPLVFEDENIEVNYENIQYVIEEQQDWCKLNIGDWNAMVGKVEDEKIMRKSLVSIKK